MRSRKQVVASAAEYFRGDVWLADLDPAVGSEQGKRRPVVIIQNDVGNRFSPVVIVAAVTSALAKDYPTIVRVGASEGGLREDSAVQLNQIRTIDKRRLLSRWGTLSAEATAKVDQAIKVSLGLVPV